MQYLNIVKDKNHVFATGLFGTEESRLQYQEMTNKDGVQVIGKVSIDCSVTPPKITFEEV